MKYSRVLCSLILSAFSGMAIAQSTPQPFYPRCWMWSYPKYALTSGCTAWKRSDYLIPIVRIDHHDYDQGPNNATLVAAAARAKIANLRSLGYLDPVSPQVAVLIQNFGLPHEAISANTDADADPTSLFVQSDNVDVDIDGDPLHAPDWQDSADIVSARPWRQPWMTNGIPHAWQWMDSFLTVYKSDSNYVPIDRFHFDLEYVITNVGSPNYTFLVKAMTQENDGQHDGRWSNTPVPGFDPNTTMAQLWATHPSGWHSTNRLSVDS